ncbi:SWIM zinc finger domain-containing protein [Rossellomorea oryzaecorticis]|uniref:SWIM zinc finger domain-containing protein n=1 Tax=Rossellomorea oryzaecorticis TaxID=1396505 RepID=A0ABW8VQY8_9BACI
MAIRIEELKDKLIPMSRAIQGELNPGTDEGRNIVSKGLLLFRQNLVSNVKVRDEEAIADVQDVTPVSVRLDLQFPLLSKCSCPYSGWCRHQMATFFMIYNKVARVSEWIQDWRSQESSPDTDENKPSSLDELLKKHTDSGALRKASELLEERKTRGNTPDEWWQFFESLLKKEDLQLLERQPYLMDVIIQNIYKRFNKEAPFEREWKPLYQLFATFFLTLEVDVFLQEREIELSREQYALFDFLLDEMEDAVEKLSVHAMPFSFDPFIAYLKEKSAEMSEDPKHSTEIKAEVYRFIWYYLFKQKAWRRQEVGRLESSPSQDDPFIKIALLHQYLLLEDLDKAEETVERIGTELVSYSEFWLVKFVLSKRYEGLLLLLKAILVRLPSYIEEKSHYEASSFVRWFVRKLPTEWLMERDPVFLRELLLAMLPFSYYSYSEFLLSSKSHREWVELQKYMGYSVGEMENMGLSQVYKESPELALPVYYNGVIDMIEQKNRDSYKYAVRYMKKIRTIYKKLKQTDKWDDYLPYILEKYKRLRAFQEECRKGKLIDA